MRLLITITRSNFRDNNNNKLFPHASRVDRRFLIGGCFIHPSISLLLNRFNEQLTRYAPFLSVNKRSFILLFQKDGRRERSEENNFPTTPSRLGQIHGSAFLSRNRDQFSIGGRCLEKGWPTSYRFQRRWNRDRCLPAAFPSRENSQGPDISGIYRERIVNGRYVTRILSTALIISRYSALRSKGALSNLQLRFFPSLLNTVNGASLTFFLSLSIQPNSIHDIDRFFLFFPSVFLSKCDTSWGGYIIKVFASRSWANVSRSISFFPHP